MSYLNVYFNPIFLLAFHISTSLQDTFPPCDSKASRITPTLFKREWLLLIAQAWDLYWGTQNVRLKNCNSVVFHTEFLHQLHSKWLLLFWLFKIHFHFTFGHKQGIFKFPLRVGNTGKIRLLINQSNCSISVFEPLSATAI